MEWTRKHQELTSTSVNFRSSVNKAEQDLPVRQIRATPAKASTLPWSAKRSWAKSSGWRKKPGSTEATQSSMTARCQQTVRLKQPNKGLNQSINQSINPLCNHVSPGRLPDQIAGNARRHENERTTTMQPATKLLSQPATSSSDTMWVKMSKVWSWKPVCISFVVGRILLAAR